MWHLGELKELSNSTGIDVRYLYEISKTCNNIIDLLKCIRNNINQSGYINLLIQDTQFRTGVRIESKPFSKNQIRKSENIDLSSFGKFYFPIKKCDMETFTKLIAKNLSDEFGTANKFFPGRKHPISINDNQYNIGFKSKNSALVKTLIGSMIDSSK